MISYFCTMSVEITNIAFVGLKGTNSMISGIGLAAMFFNITVVALVIGFNMGLSTLVS
jgi:hypothetical protein